MARSVDRTRIARTMARALGAPIGILAVLDHACVRVGVAGGPAGGDGGDAADAGRAGLGAGDLAAVEGVVLVPDLAADPRFAGGCWARLAPAARALALAPARHAGRHLGVVAVMDTRPRAWTPAEGEVLRDLADLALDNERLQATEERLRESEERYRVLFEKAGEVIVVADAAPATAGTILDVNEAALRLYGYAREELLGQSTRLIIAPGQEALLRGTQHVAAGAWVRTRLLHVKRDGTRFPVEVLRGPVEIGGKPRMLAFVQDLAERVRAEEALRAAKEAADSANHAKSAFLANMSHEIRTPMNAVLGYTQLLEREAGLSADQREYLRVIHQAGDHLLGLIDDVLEMSKIEAGHRALDAGDVDTAALTADLARLFELRARAKGLSFAVHRGPDVPPVVVADEGRLRQVLVNLIGNALKFTDRGHVVLQVRVEGGGGELVLEVEDTGPGIEPEMLPQLFRPFVQARLGLHARGGTGLGLALSREYARLMGGDLTVVSSVGAGSVFRLAIPCQPSTAAPGARPAPRARVVRLAGGEAAPRILVVDDEADNRTWLALLLRAVGFEVREAHDGAEALAIFVPWQPHLVLMDVNMPVMDGLAAVRAIRALPEGQHAALVAVTASAFKEEEAAILAAGADSVLRKPCREAAVLDEIQRRLGVTYMHADPGAPEERGGPVVGHGGGHGGHGVSALPADLVATLVWAARIADYEQLVGLIARVPAEHAGVAAALSALADGYRYEEIVALLQG